MCKLNVFPILSPLSYKNITEIFIYYLSLHRALVKPVERIILSQNSISLWNPSQKKWGLNWERHGSDLMIKDTNALCGCNSL